MASHALLLRRRDDARYRRLACVALVTAALPVGLAADGALSLPEVLPVVGPLDALGLLSPLLCGSALLGLSLWSRFTRFGQGLATLAVLLVTGAAFVGSAVAFQDVLGGWLAHLGLHPAFVLLGLSLLGVGADLRRRRAEMDTGRPPPAAAWWLRLAGALLLLAMYALPLRGEPLALSLLQRVTAAARTSTALVTTAPSWLVGAAPVAIALGALVSLRPAQSRDAGGREGLLLGLSARHGLPIAVLLASLPPLGEGPYAVLLGGRAALLLALAIGLCAAAGEALARHLLIDSLPPVPPASRLARDVRLRQLVRAFLRRGLDGAPLFDAAGVPPSHPWLRWLMRRRLRDLARELPRAPLDPARPDVATARRYLAGLCSTETPPDDESAPEAEPGALWLSTGRVRLPALGLAVVAFVAALALWLRPAERDLSFALGERSEAADAFFGKRLPSFVMRLTTLRGRGASPTTGDTRALLDAAGDLDAQLAERIEHTLRVAASADRTGRLWIDAIHGINRRLRQVGLPYYLDGNVMVAERDGAAAHLFYLTSYTVHAVRRFRAGSEPYAALHVRRLDQLRLGGRRLGMVRRDEPFALVMVDEIERAVAARLEAVRTRGRCDLPGSHGDDDRRALDERCGQTLVSMLRARDLDLEREPERVAELVMRLQIVATERHEIQHQVDGDDVPVALDLFALAPSAPEEELADAARELSAQLAELGSADDLSVAWQIAGLMGQSLSDAAPLRYRRAATLIMSRLDGEGLAADRRAWTERAAGIWRQVEVRQDLGAWVHPIAERAHRDLCGSPIAPVQPLD